MSRCSLFIVFAMVTVLPCGQVHAGAEVAELIEDGIELRDEGRNAEAAEIFLAAVQADGESSEAFLQLSSTYADMAEYDTCVSVARQGLKLDSGAKAQLSAVLGLCYAGDGQVAKARRTYKKALQNHPDEPSLNYNMAVLLLDDGKQEDAIVCLKKVVQHDQEHAPAYFLLGRLFADERCYVPAIYSYMRFVALEPNTRKSVKASRQVFEMLHLGGDAEGRQPADGPPYPNPPAVEADLSVLESSRARAAAAIVNREQQSVGEPGVSVGALVAFMETSVELGDTQLADSFTWQYLAQAPALIYREGLFEPFAYLLAARAEIDGAVDWLKENPHRLGQLTRLLSES